MATLSAQKIGNAVGAGVDNYVEAEVGNPVSAGVGNSVGFNNLRKKWYRRSKAPRGACDASCTGLHRVSICVADGAGTEAAGTNMLGPRITQDVASEVDERPAMQVVQVALDRTETLSAPQLVQIMEAVGADEPVSAFA